MVELDLGVFALQRLGDDVPPQTRGREHVCLVDRKDRERRIDREGDLRRHAGDAPDLLDAVGHLVPRDVLLGRDVLFLAFAKVEPADELADDDDVDALGDRLLQRRVDDERVGGKVARADVGVEAEGFAEGEQAGLGADFAVDAPFGPTDGAYGGAVRVRRSGKLRGRGERGRNEGCALFHVPISMASASLHACKVKAGSASPTSSMAHPPKRRVSSLSSSSDDSAKMASSTLTASATTSGPGNYF